MSHKTQKDTQEPHNKQARNDVQNWVTLLSKKSHRYDNTYVGRGGIIHDKISHVCV